MFDRETSRQLEALFARTGTGPERLLRMSAGMLLLLQAIFESLTTTKSLWDNGFGAQVAAAETGSIINGYTKRWWLLLQAVYTVYTITMKMPLRYLVNLSDVDGNYPFHAFNINALGELSHLSIEQVAWMEPETVAQTESEQGIDPPME